MVFFCVSERACKLVSNTEKTTEGELATKLEMLMGDGEWETDLPCQLGWILFALGRRVPSANRTRAKARTVNNCLDICQLCELRDGSLDLFKNNRLVNFSAPKVFSHSCCTQKKACKKLAPYVLFSPSHSRLDKH